MKYSVCLFDFSTITDPIKVLTAIKSPIIEMINLEKYYEENGIAEIVEFMKCVRSHNKLVMLRVQKVIPDIIKIVSADVVFCDLNTVSEEDISYYVNNLTPIVLLVHSDNIDKSLKLHEKINCHLLVDSSIRIDLLEKYKINKDLIFFRDLPLCTAYDFGVHSTLSLIGTINEVASGTSVTNIVLQQELAKYTKKYKECRNCNQKKCLGQRRDYFVPTCLTNENVVLNYDSLMTDLLCRNLPKVNKELIDVDNYTNSFFPPLLESMKIQREFGSFEGEDFCYVLTPSKTFYFCRSSEKGDVLLKECNGSLQMNLFFLNANEEEFKEKLSYDTILPKDSIEILLKVKLQNYTMAEIHGLFDLSKNLLKSLLAPYLSEDLVLTEDAAHLYLNGKKFIGHEFYIDNNVYIDSIYIYSSLIHEEDAFALMRNKNDFSSRVGLSDLIPTISSKVISEFMYNGYYTFFKNKKTKVLDFGYKQNENKQMLIEAAKELHVTNPIMEVCSGNLKLFKDSITVDKDSRCAVDIHAYFNESFIRDKVQNGTTVVMCRCHAVEDLIKNISIVRDLELLFSKNCRFIIYFAMIEYDPLCYKMWIKTLEDIRYEIGFYGLSEKYEVLDLQNGFFEIRRKNV